MAKDYEMNIKKTLLVSNCYFLNALFDISEFQTMQSKYKRFVSCKRFLSDFFKGPM